MAPDLSREGLVSGRLSTGLWVPWGSPHPPWSSRVGKRGQPLLAPSGLFRCV